MLRRPKTYVYLALIVFIGFIFYDVGEQVYWWQTGRVLAQRAAPVAYNRQLVGEHQRVLFIGDSTVVGTGALIPDDSIVGRFGRDCPNLEIINLGKNGDRVPRLDARFDPKAVGKFDLIVIQIGGNDVVFSTDPVVVSLAIDNILRKAKLASGKVALVFSGSDLDDAPFFPWFLDQTISNRSRQIMGILKTAAEKNNVFFVDMNGTVAEQIIFLAPGKYFASDHFHPNSDGYSLWYGQMKNELVSGGVVKMKTTGLKSECFID